MMRCKNKTLFKSFFLFFGFFVFSTLSVYAQGGIEGFTVASLEFSDKFPTPGEKIKVTLKAPTINKETALVTWTINGKVVKKGYSSAEIEFQVGDVGDVYRIAVEAVDARDRRITTEKTIRVSDVAIIWEARTYTPPFYEGRALQSPGAEIAFHAIPSIVDDKGRLYNPDELIYIWSTNYSQETTGGRSARSVVLKNDTPLETFIVNLQVKDLQGEVRSVKKISIPVAHPKVLLYEDSSLVGIRHDTAIAKDFGIYGKESTVIAEPYYMSAPTRTSPALEYTWSIDDKKYTNPGNLTFSPEGSVSGTSYLNLIIKNTKYWLQNGQASVTINYGQRNTWIDEATENTL